MTTVLSHEAYHHSVGWAFGELLVLEQMSQLPPDSVLRVLQSIPQPLLRHALASGEAAAEVKAERRASPRRKVLRGARVMVAGAAVAEVQVRDISEGGCRIWSRQPSCVPDRFTIRIVGFGGQRPCAVRWRAGEEIGVEFLSG